MRFLDEPEIRLLAAAMPTAQDRLVVLAAAYTGLRAGELWALKRGDVNLLTRQLIVDEALKDVAGHLAFGPPKTANSRRALALPVFPCDELAKLMPANGAPTISCSATRTAAPSDTGTSTGARGGRP